MTDTNDRFGRALYLKDLAPGFVNTFVARGRAEIDKRQQQVHQRATSARSLGEVAVAFGLPMVRDRVQQQAEIAKGRAEAFLDTARHARTPGTPPASERPHAAPQPGFATPANGSARANGDTRANVNLPIPGYDALSASQVVERLTGLARPELDAVHAYENAHRQRRTILGKIEQLAG
jgi:hypothetical protein